MELDGKSFRLELAPVRSWAEPGLDPDYFAREFREALFEGLTGAGLRPKTSHDAQADFTSQACVNNLDPGNKWERHFFAPLAGGAVGDAEVAVGDGQSNWGAVQASGKRRFAWFEPNDDSVSLLADAARLAGKHAARHVVSLLRKR